MKEGAPCPMAYQACTGRTWEARGAVRGDGGSGSGGGGGGGGRHWELQPCEQCAGLLPNKAATVIVLDGLVHLGGSEMPGFHCVLARLPPHRPPENGAKAAASLSCITHLASHSS
jgi:hypothetical protein